MEKIFLGKWHITEMERCSNEKLNKSGQAFIEFENNGRGQFLLCSTEAFVDYRINHHNDNLRLEFSFEGIDENRQVSGRGWLLVKGDRMHGHIYFHQGKDSQFAAQRVLDTNVSMHVIDRASRSQIL